MLLKPSDIRYSQENINDRFKANTRHGGQLIGRTLDDICEGECDISDIPTISVKWVDRKGYWMTADNRRLWVFKQLERLGKCTEIQVQTTTYIEPRKVSTLNNGTSIGIRRGGPGGKWYLKPTPQGTSSNSKLTPHSYPERHVTQANNYQDLQHGIEDEGISTRFQHLFRKQTEPKSPRFGFDLAGHSAQAKAQSSDFQFRTPSTSMGTPPRYPTSLSGGSDQGIPIEQASGGGKIFGSMSGSQGLSSRTNQKPMENIEEKGKQREFIDHRFDEYKKKLPINHPKQTGSKKDRLQVAAIDLGTTFSGYAFSFRNQFEADPLKIMTNQWTTGSNVGGSLKTSTCILFDPQRRFRSFGFDAEDAYAELADKGLHAKWYYFKRFKMFLYENQTLNRRSVLRDDNGNELPAMTVFSESIRFLKDHFFKSCTKRLYVLAEKDTNWVLTVPAIWSDSAKQFMREAAIEAGIDADRLSLALEPEAASVFCKHVLIDRPFGVDGSEISCFKPGTRYMVLDAGGGTIDITVHETQRDGTVRELYKANGGPWGGTRVDQAFLTFLTDISSKETLEQLKKTRMDDYLDIMRDFEIKKTMTSPDLDRRITLKMPVSFQEIYASLHGEEISSRNKLNTNISFTGDKLRVNPEVVQGFFTEPCEQIVGHLVQVFSHHEVRGTGTILMVGGFSESKMLQAAVRRTFPDKRVVVPAEAGLAVLKGAVIFGHNPNAVASRISRFTYGVGASVLFDPQIHPVKRQFEAEDKLYCANVFDIHVSAGDEVKEGVSFKTQTYFPIYSTATKMSIKIFKSDKKRLSFTDEEGCQRLGSILVDFSTLVLKSDKGVRVCMKYGGTELHVEAHVVKTGQKATAQFEFLG